MIERVHQHLLSELERTTRVDTIFVVCAVLFNILALFISWSQVPTSSGSYRSGSLGIYMLTTAGIVVVSGAALKALQNGRRTYQELNKSLIQIYKDAGVEKYLPKDVNMTGINRFRLFFVVVAGTSFLAIAIPLLQYFDEKGTEPFFYLPCQSPIR